MDPTELKTGKQFYRITVWWLIDEYLIQIGENYKINTLIPDVTFCS